MKHFVSTFIFFIISNFSFGQNIIAGLYDSTDIYTNPEPDEICLSTNGYGDYHHMDDTLRLDIDKNGIDDYKFSSSFFWSMYTGNMYHALITPLNSQNHIVSRFDTVTYYTSPSPSIAIYTVPLALNVGDTINLNTNYHLTATTNYLADISPGYPPSDSAWSNIGDHFVGIVMYLPNDTLFGWIRLSVFYSQIIIKDYACNRNPNSNYNSTEPYFPYDIFPNPANNYIIVANNQKSNPIKSISIWSIEGKLISEINSINDSRNTTIDISGLSPAIYILKIESSEKFYSKKLVVR